MDIAAERSYDTPFANSPLLPLLLLSLATQRNAPKESSCFKKEYDYIVVGGGAAGCVVASRLSEEPCVTVLLLEAGAVKPPLLNDIPGIARFFWFSDIDWQYKTVPQKNAAYGLVGKQVIWPSGKGFGGSSLLNGMLYVRGNHKDYDNWAAQGAKGWSYEDVFPYFLKLEDNRNFDYLTNGYHASGGPVTVEKPRYQVEFKNPIIKVAQQMGYKVGDSNASNQTGFYDLQATIRNGQRCSAAKAYLVPAENRTNLDIVGGAHVKKVLFDGHRAVGVLFSYKNSDHVVRARREVVMSAGTTNTAQLLMLSGVGPRKHLQELNIPVIADLPVGNNLQDHCCSFIPFVSYTLPINDKLKSPQNIKEYIDTRTGPLNSAEFVSMIAFLGGQPEKDLPECQIFFGEVNKVMGKTQVGIKSILYKAFISAYEDGPLNVCLSMQLHPKSRGTVRLQSTNPYDPPLIDPNYFDDPTDVDEIITGLKNCLKILWGKPMKDVGAKPFATIFPAFMQLLPHLDKYLKIIAKSIIVTANHQVGTAKMGDPMDPTTVVDACLRVKGIEGLRVVDASVMPIVPSGNTYAPTLMVAEKASDIIKESRSCASP